MSNTKSLKILNLVAFLFMIIVNILAETLPINGMTTGQVSDSYPNLFTPAAGTFSIWGLIYLLLTVFILYQFGIFNGSGSASRDGIIESIGIYFALSSFANAAWLFAWHYRLIPLTVLFMLILLACLAIIVSKISRKQLTVKEKFLVRVPFSVYFGWITVAAIANIVILFVSMHWGGLGMSEQVWTVIVLILGLLISTAVIMKNKDVAYGLAIIWAYSGILIRHLSAKGFQGQYHMVVSAVIISLVVLVLTVLFVSAMNKKHPLKL